MPKLIDLVPVMTIADAERAREMLRSISEQLGAVNVLLAKRVPSGKDGDDIACVLDDCPRLQDSVSRINARLDASADGHHDALAELGG